ncbi:hypothetical protein OsJ_06483 [Oryza sativa Japonica Group]|uniref:Uncharacterized protein n=1 Tax=Oryza sativa subsp. japonica TaxID=39947 RepID=A3A668_ORYSJ|nr:hypothetical protein OsJ_06483 [Oryza sativa Japonica Group]
MAAAASERSCRDEAAEIGGELDADDEAVDEEEFVGDRANSAVLFTTVSRGSDGDDAAVTELSLWIVSPQSEVMKPEPQPLPAAFAPPSSPSPSP